MRKFMRRFKFLFKIHRSIPFLFDFFTSKEVKLRVKVLFIILIIGYVAIPFDLIPDLITVFGLADDVTVVLMLLQLMMKVAPDSLKKKYENFI